MTNQNGEEGKSVRQRYRPNTRDIEVEKQATERNVGIVERIVSGIVGAGLLWASLRRPSVRTGTLNRAGALMGLALLHRATTGFCAMYAWLDLNSNEPDGDTSAIGRRKVHTDRAIKLEESVVIERSPRELFQFWRHVENLPKVMSHLKGVSPIDEYRSHWILNILGGELTLEWDAEIINEVENERIGWRTLQGAIVEHTGAVVFTPLEEGRSCRIIVRLQYDPPAGPIGAALASLLGQDPAPTLHQDLLHFKQSMESSKQEVA